MPAAEFARWAEADRLALLINLYNAQTLRLIINHYPVKSIRAIGLLPGAAWRELIVRQGGQIMTLSHLENKVIRVEYDGAAHSLRAGVCGGGVSAPARRALCGRTPERPA